MPELKGVLISCIGDMEANRLPRFSPIIFDDISINSDLFAFNPSVGGQDQGGFSPIAEKAGFALYLRRRNFDPDKDTGNREYNDNPSAVHLRKSITPKDTAFGYAPMGWIGHIGSVVAIRVDKKELLPEHVEALCDLCEFGMMDIFTAETIEWAMENGYKQVERALDAIISPEGFRCHWEKYRANKAVGDQRWRNLPSPFEM